MKTYFYLAFAFILLRSTSFAQQKEVLFTIDNKPYYNDEFLRVYNKNLDLVKDESQKNLDTYLDLYIGYKLKVEKANKLGLQNGTAYLNELKSYRTQLSKNYLNDSKVTEELVKEAYERMKKEVRAYHILVMVDEGAAAEDTLKAYQKIVDLRNRVTGGEHFEKVAVQFSEDPSAKENTGDLGYFSAFRMVYPFENAAFNTKIGSVSKPFRTRFGYHIIKVVDIRESQAEVTVAHIMLSKSDDANLEAKNKQTIEELYKKLQQGESFDALAKQFSEDKSTAIRGGVLQRFGSGQLSSEAFEKTAFSLKNKGDLSQPLQTQFGWHILKLIEKHPLRTYSELKPELEEKIKKDERSLLITNSLAKKLRAKYKIAKNTSQLNSIKKELTNAYYDEKWEIPASLKNDKALLTIDATKKSSTEAFSNYVYSQQKSKIKTKPLSKLVDDLLEKYTDQQLIAHYDSNLEQEFPDFKYIMDEYRDGLLLFDLMDQEIWKKSKTDSIGIAAFYKNNTKNYQWKKRYDVVIYSSTEMKFVENAKKMLQKGKSASAIKEALNKDGKINIIEKSGLYEGDFDILSEYKNLEKGITEIVSKGNYHFVVEVKDTKEATTKELEACKGKVISDYQTFLENNWVDELKKEFKVEVKQPVFLKIKSQLQK